MASSTNRQSGTFTREFGEPSDNPSPTVLDFYRHPAGMSQFGRYIPLVAGLPADVERLVPIVQGLAIHEYMAKAYGITIPESRKSESHLRPVTQLMERLLGAGEGPLTTPRPPARRLVGVCHHFMLVLVAMLRAKGIPARGRCGFGSYFNPGYFEDHWVTEYWNEQEGRWILVDPQFDEVWRRELKIEHDVMDVPRDRFLVAGDAWVLCKEGKADPSKFGIFKGDLRGLWFIAGNLIRDVASLNKVEMLPWDVWGGMPKPNQPVTDEASRFFDRLAGLTRSPDENFEELTSMYPSDDRLRVPRQVFNSMLQREEVVEV
jgi:hypothetical protein